MQKGNNMDTIGGFMGKYNDMYDLIDLLKINKTIFDISEELIDSYGEFFDVWWDYNNFNWAYSSKLVNTINTEYFGLWWNSEKFNYDESSCYYLHIYLRHEVKIWMNINVLKILRREIILEYYMDEYIKWFNSCSREEDKLYLINKFGVCDGKTC